MKKIFYFGIIFLCLFLINDNVHAKTMIDKTTKVYECNYKSSDGKSTAVYRVYKYNNMTSSNSSLTREQEITIKTYNDKPLNNDEHNKSIGEATKIYIYNKCPGYMAIKEDSGYKAAVYWTEASAEKYIGSKKGVILNLTNSYLSQLEGVTKYHDYQAKKYECILDGTDPFCVNPISEGFYDCKFGGDLTFNFAESYTVMLNGLANSGINLSTFNSQTVATGKCPSVVYSLTKGDKTYLKFYGDEWPGICKTDPDVTCKKHTQNAVSEYNYTEPVEEVSKTYTYYYGELKGTLSFNYMEYDYHNSLTLHVKGKSDGTIEKVTLKLNNSDIYFASANESAMKSAIEEFLKLKGGTAMPSKITCAENSKITKDGNKAVTGITGVIPPSGYTGKLCEAWDFGGTGIAGGDTYYLSDFVTNDEEHQTQQDVIDTLENLGTGFDDGWSLNCEGKEDTKGCAEFQYNTYKRALNLQKICKEYYADFTVLQEVIDSCDAFQNDIVTWAEAGYFGNRVITNQSGSSCDDVLGALGVWLKKIYDIMKYAVPIIIVVLGIKDFISGTISGKDDALKKAGSTFVKRLIWGAVFVALPVLITMILTFAFGGSFADICIF